MKVSDYDLDFLGEQLALIDKQLTSIIEDASEYTDPDSIESLTGLGFVACQRFLTTIYGWMNLPKHSAVKLGPKHSSGLAVVEIINHAANYWKHHEEWNGERKSKNQETTEAGLRMIGVLDSEYVLQSTLNALCGETLMFKSLLPTLTLWRDACESEH